MSNRITTVVTLIAVSLHVLLGCCWHHGHSLEADDMQQASACECVFHADYASSEPNESEPSESCDHVSCTFYSPDAADSEFLSDNSVSWCCTLTAALAADTLSRLNDGASELPDIDHSLLLPPQQLHAIMQLWLI